MIYEVAWTRLFTVIIGNTVFSVSTILIVFMAGLALGSRLAGRFIDRKPVRLSRAYAVLETGIGVYNLLLPIFLLAADPLFGAVYSSSYNSPVVLGVARVLISCGLLIVPATLMGATLPILVRFYADNIAQAGWHAGRLYALNTCGAAVGAAAAGFVLIPQGGVMFTMYFAAALNIVIAVVAWFAGRHDEAATAHPTIETSVRSPAILLGAMFLSGLAALMNEVAWTRVLALVVGPTTYAFTLMLCSMITGLGLGAAVSAHWIKKHDAALRVFGWIQLAVAAASLAVIPALGEMPIWIGRLVSGRSGSFAEIQVLEMLIFFALLLVPTSLLGMTFPIASKLYARMDASLGEDVGTIYAFNTVGGIAGSILAGFLIIPSLGSYWILIIASSISALIGSVVLALHGKRRGRVLQAAFGVAFVVVVMRMPNWNPELMAAGAYKYAPLYSSNADLESMLTRGDILSFKEGAASTVTVRKNRGVVTLAIDGKIDATDAGDMTTQKMLAHLPLLLTRNAKRVAVIGLGSGVTAGAALKHPIDKLDVIEISPEVIEASRFFSHVHDDPLSDSRTELIVGDGRNHLRYAKRQYDVTISEPSNPWMAGMASLFTRDFFAEVQASLAPGGIHCQWFHSYNMSLDDVRTVIATFRAEFPHAMLWSINDYDFFLLGSASEITIDETVFEENFRRIAPDLAKIRIHDPYSIVTSLMLRDAELDTFAAGAALNTDDMPVLEFRAPRAIHADTTAENLAALMAVPRAPETIPYVKKLTEKPTAENHRRRGEMLLAAEAFPNALKEFEAAVALDGGNREARLDLADFYSRSSNHAKALEVLDGLAKDDPNNPDILAKMADAAANHGSSRLEEITQRLIAVAPENATGLYHLATLHLYRGRLDEAIQTAKQALEADPKSIRTRNLLAVAYDRTFQPAQSEAEFRRLIREAPDDFVTRNNYGIFLLGRDRSAEAREQFLAAISINPENVQAFIGMGEAFRQSGNTREADDWYRKALRLDPDNPVAKQYVK